MHAPAPPPAATGIETMTAADYPAVAEIFSHGIATGLATLETAPPGWNEWNATHLPSCRIIARTSTGEVAGWAALTPVSGRCVYRGVAEVSVYVHPQHHRQGIGRQLLQHLVQASEKEGIWTLQAGIFAINEASIQLHRQCGFRLVGVREKLGQLHGEWRDIALLERRSKVVGI